MTGAPNPFATPEADPSPGAPARGVDVEAIRRVARAHRRLILVFLAQLVLAFGFMFIIGAVGSDPANRDIASALTVVWLVGLMGLLATLLISLYQLTRALEWGVGGAVLAVLGCFIGLVNLIVILTAVSRGNRRLKEAGLRVGFLGVPSSEVEAWARRTA